MSETAKGVLAMVGACVVWGLSPLFYKLLADVPPPEVLAHRTLWSIVFFGMVLAAQGRLREIQIALGNRRQLLIIFIASVLISINWFTFILSVQIGKATESSLGYYIFPLIAVVIGAVWFGEKLSRVQWFAVGAAAFAVASLTWGLGVAPWISLIVSISFALYGVIKKGMALGPVVSVTCEILVLLPIWVLVLFWYHVQGQGHFATDWTTSLLLVLSGPLTAIPLIMFSYAARRVALGTVGLLQYVNPTLQFICAVAVFGEPFGWWHKMAFTVIWIALALFSLSSLRQDREARRASKASSGVSTQVRKEASEESANP
ncbi:EamA family transporter RarD [Phaeobacter sp. NW0010-22]|uniref:EamA family transporter RarD n=1 Tax=Phaeobacter sp. NW0010-22 TaxID=3135907 RepID=UPI00310BC9B1